MLQCAPFEIATLTNQRKGLHIMQTLLGLLIMFFLNGMGAYLAYRLITWFETGRIHTEQQDFRPNIKRVK